MIGSCSSDSPLYVSHHFSSPTEGRVHAEENTIPAFELALKLGATGLETDAAKPGWDSRLGP